MVWFISVDGALLIASIAFTLSNIPDVITNYNAFVCGRPYREAAIGGLMILRFLTLMVLVVSLAVPGLAKPAQVKNCPMQSSVEMCHVLPLQGIMQGQFSFEMPCGAKALPCPKGAVPNWVEREAVLSFIETHVAWVSQTFGPPEKPPRI